MGSRYVNQDAFSPAVVMGEASSSTPIFFILFPGYSPSKEIEAYAREVNHTVENGKLTLISMGQARYSSLMPKAAVWRTVFFVPCRVCCLTKQPEPLYQYHVLLKSTSHHIAINAHSWSQRLLVPVFALHDDMQPVAYKSRCPLMG